MPAQPLATVVIPTFSRPDLLLQCVQSVLAQDAPFPFEVVVVDDGGTPAATRSLAGVLDPRLRIYRQENSGPARARNRGMKEAHGRIIAFIDDDCAAHAGWLTAGVQRFSDDVVMVQGPVEPPERASPLLWHYIEAVSGRHDLTCNLFVLRDAALKVCGFDEKFPDPAGEDYEFCWRVDHLGRVVFEPSACITHALIPLTWKKRRARPRLWRSNYRFYGLHPDRLGKAALPGLERLAGRFLDENPLIRLTTYLAGAGFVELVRNMLERGPRGAGVELVASLFNLVEFALRTPEYLRLYAQAREEARVRDAIRAGQPALAVEGSPAVATASEAAPLIIIRSAG